MSKRFMTALLILAIAALCSIAMYAQQPEQNPGQGGEHHGQSMMTSQGQLDRLTKELNLTKDQQDKIKPILDDQMKQAQALRSDTSLSQQDRMSKMRDIHKSSTEQIRAVLTPDQQTKYDELQKKMMERGAGRGPGGQQPPPTPPQK